MGESFWKNNSLVTHILYESRILGQPISVLRNLDLNRSLVWDPYLGTCTRLCTQKVTHMVHFELGIAYYHIQPNRKFWLSVSKMRTLHNGHNSHFFQNYSCSSVDLLTSKCGGVSQYHSWCIKSCLVGFINNQPYASLESTH